MGSGAGAATEIEPLLLPPAFDSSRELSSFSSTSFSSSFAVVNWLISSSMGTWESRLPTISYEHFNKEMKEKVSHKFQIFFLLPLIYSWWENSPLILWCFPPFANMPFSPCHIPRQVQQLKWKFHQVVLLFPNFCSAALREEECKNQENCAAELEITLDRLC